MRTLDACAFRRFASLLSVVVKDAVVRDRNSDAPASRERSFMSSFRGALKARARNPWPRSDGICARFATLVVMDSGSRWRSAGMTIACPACSHADLST